MYSNGINNRQGVAIMISKRFKNVFSVVKKESGRFIHIKGKVEDQYLNIYNIYAPNDINAKCTFFENCKDKISDNENNIVTGDFNTTLASLDRSGKSKHVNDKGVKTLVDIINEKILCDIWRKRNLNDRMFSSKQLVNGYLTQSRIDYFLVSDALKPYVKNVYYNDTSFSDHCIVNMKMNFSKVEKGPGVWIFNNSFLQNEVFVGKIKKIFADEIGSDFYLSHPLVWWDNLRYRIKGISQIYGKEKQKERNKEFYKLQNYF